MAKALRFRVAAVTFLALAVVLMLPGAAHAQLTSANAEEWFGQIQNISIDGFYGVRVTNDGTSGTTNFKLACLLDGTATLCPGSTTLDILGAVQSGGGTTGAANIATHGVAQCDFAAATTAGNYVQIGASAGKCYDAGATYPTVGGRILGIVITTNGAAGVYPVFLYGRGIQAAGFVGNVDTWAVVTSDVTHAQSSTTLTDVTGLAVTVCTASTEVWQFEVNLRLTQTAVTADWKFGWTAPAGVPMSWGSTSATPTEDHWGGVTVATSPEVALGLSSTLLHGSMNGTHLLHMKGFLVCEGASPGTLQLQFAQNTSNASDNTVKKGSVMIARKLIN